MEGAITLHGCYEVVFRGICFKVYEINTGIFVDHLILRD